MRKSLGLVETIGLTAGVVAADTAVKSANVDLVGYELTKGSGMTVIKVEGDVGAVKAAVDAAAAAASKVGSVVSTKVIPRPSEYLDGLVRNEDTVGYREKKESKGAKTQTKTEEIKTEAVKAEVIKADVTKAEDDIDSIFAKDNKSPVKAAEGQTAVPVKGSEKPKPSETEVKAEKTEKVEKVEKPAKPETTVTAVKPVKAVMTEKAVTTEKAEKPEKEVKAEKAEKPEKAVKPVKAEKSEKAVKADKVEKPEKPEKPSDGDKNKVNNSKKKK